MKKRHLRLLSIASLLLTCSAARAAAAGECDDNVIIDEETAEYRIIEKRGAVDCVKARTSTTYLARRSNAGIAAVEFYGTGKRIDKASAPGATPIYRSWEAGDVFYSGARVCVLPLELSKGKPAKVRFGWTVTEPAQFCNVYLTQPYFTRRMTTRIEVPASLAATIRVRPYNFPEGMTLDSLREKDGKVVYTVEASDVRAHKDEKMAVAPSVSAPQLIITGQFADHTGIYRYLRSFVADEAPDTEIEALSRRLTAAAPDTIAAIDSIASWVRENIRYVAIEHGDYGVRPAAAAEVLACRYGDCKGSANLIKALLRASGIDGRLAWIGVRGIVPHRWSETPAMLSGNHCIAAAVLSDTIVYADGTARYCPAGYIPPSIRGMEAMIEDGRDACLLRSVPDDGAADTARVTARYRIAGDDLAGTLEHRLGGVMKMRAAAVVGAAASRSRDDVCRRLLAYPKKNVAADSIEFVVPSPWAACARLSGRVVEKGAARAVGDAIFVDLRPLRMLYDESVDSRGRTRDIDLAPAYACEVDMTLQIPEGYAAAGLPQPMSVESPWFSAAVEYSSTPDASGAGSMLRCRASMRKQRLSARADEAEAYNRAVRELRRMSETQVKLTRCGQAAEEMNE